MTESAAPTWLWARHLKGVPMVLDLPSDRPRQEGAPARAAVDLGAAAGSALAERARTLGITPFGLALGAFGLALSRWTGARSLLVGVPIAGPENLVPVRIDVDDDKTPADFLCSVQGSLAFSVDFAGLPFAELVSGLRIHRAPGSHPLVQVCFGMGGTLVPGRAATGSVRMPADEHGPGGARFDLSLMIERAEPSLTGYLEYASGVLTAAEAAGLAEDFRAAAEQLTAAVSPAEAGIPLHEVRCLSAARRAVLDQVNETRRHFPASSVDELFREAARSRPTAVAVRDGEAELTFEQLAGAAARQARLLREAGVEVGDRVLIGVERSVAEAVAVLGTLWAGAAYVGVDMSLPPAHIAKIVAKSAPKAAIAGPGDADRLLPHGVGLVTPWQPGWPVTAADAAPPAASDPARLAYVAFTSGSTGDPKGVAVPHRAVIRLVHEAGYLRLGPDERMLRLSPLAFDASTLELWGPLLTGATLEVAPAGLLSPSELGAFLVERRVTVAWLTAGLFRLVQEFAPDSLDGLRHLLTGGDVVPHEHVARALRRNAGLTVTNGYGPTENTTFTTVYSVTRPQDVDGPLPIGTPVPGTQVYVLDERGRLVPPGAVGELYTGGEGLADGYLGDEQETARKFGFFSPDVPGRLYRTGDMVRFDGSGRLRFLGRTDDQVKLRGYRVELSAISAALTACPGVSDAVVTVTDVEYGDKRLVAAVVPEAGATVVPLDLRDRLAGQLPSYMVPALWAVVDSIPVTANGKVDRRALVAAAGPAGTPRAPSAQTRALPRIQALFAEVIGPAGSPAELTAETDFFMAGGNSLAAIRLMGLVRKQLGVTLPLRDFLLAPTPTGLSQLVDKARSDKARSDKARSGLS